MKKRGISTLEIHRILEDNGVTVPQRTLHYQLEKGILEEKNKLAADVVDFMIEEYDKSLLKVRRLFGNEVVPN